MANTTSYTYDAAHQRKSVTDPDNHQQSVIYDGDGNVIQSTDASGNPTTNSYDQKDQLIKVVAPFVHGGRTTTTEYVYDANGNKTQDISPRAYDASTDKTTFTNYVTSYRYDADNELLREATPTDASTTAAYIHYHYDPNGRQSWVSLPVSKSDPANVPAAAKTVYSYFDPGWVATSKDPATPMVHFGYTAQGWQASRAPENSSGGLDTSLQQQWTYYPDGKTASYTDQGGQASSYHYDADNNLTYAKTDHGASGSQSPVEVYTDYTGFDQVAATHYRKTSASTYTGTAYTYDHDGNVTERDDNTTENLTSQTTNSNGVPVSWTFTPTTNSAPDVNTMSYDAADWLSTHYDKGTTSSCTGDKRINTSWTPTGWEKTISVNQEDSTCTYSLKQKTALAYFDNGLLQSETITNGSGTVLETHTLGYQTNGIYLDGNPTSDAYALNGPSSTACTGTTASCTATYSYDARDRLTSYTDGHGGTTSYTFDQTNQADPSIRAGNITTQTTPQGTTTYAYNGTQLTSATTGGTTSKYWYDPLGRLTCLTTSAGTAASCNTINSNSVSPAVITGYSYDFMDRFTAVHSYSAGTPTSSATYVYDALDRTASETETHNSANLNRTTTFTYQGLTSLATQEVQNNTGATTSTDTKTYGYDAYGTRVSMDDSTTAHSYLYGYNPHGDVSLLTDQTSNTVKASYGYTPYGASDTTLSKGDTSANSPFNPYRYSAKRLDSGTKTYDTGARRYDPAAQRFLQLDQFQGALADLDLASDPLTQNRYSLGASNPLSGVEWDGHMFVAGYGGGAAPSPNPATSQPTPTRAPAASPIIAHITRLTAMLGGTPAPASHSASTAPQRTVVNKDPLGCTYPREMNLGACPGEVRSVWYGLRASHIQAWQIGVTVLTLAIPGAGEASDIAEGASAAATAASEGTTTAAEDIGGGAARTLFHYTSEQGLAGIRGSGQLNASLAGGPDATFGSGQYLTDIGPESIASGSKASMTPEQLNSGMISRWQLSRLLYGNPWRAPALTHWLELDVTGLNVSQEAPNIFRIPGEEPLDVTNRVVNWGETP